MILKSVLSKPLGQGFELLLDGLSALLGSLSVAVASLATFSIFFPSNLGWEDEGILINSLGKEENLISLLQETLDEGGGGDLLL